MKRLRKSMAFLCVVALVIGILPTNSASAATKVKSLQLDKTTYVMKKGEQLALKAKVSPSSAKGSLWWKSSNPKVAVVNWKGVVTARQKGKATITAFAGDKKCSCSIIVGAPVKKIKPSKKTVTVSAGKTTKLKTRILPETASIKKLQYSSKNKKVATVNKKGVVKGIKEGTTQVTVNSTDGHNKSAKIKVKVTPKKISKTTEPTINLTVNPIINITIPTANPPTNTSIATSDVTGIYLSDTEKELHLNETAKLSASLIPNNAAGTAIMWNSSDESVATVSDTGLVTPEKEGTAEITATVAGGSYSAKCTVTVIPTAIVSNDKEIAYALSKKNLKTLEIDSDTTRKLTIPEGKYADVDMIVSLPNGELENHGVFKSITIEKIATDTFIENAIGNTINVLSKNSHIVITDGANATLIISEESRQIEIENHGTVKKLTIHSKGTVDITGDSDKKIPVEVKAEVSISTTQRLDVEASHYFDITIRPGAESTEIEVDAEVNLPDIFGLGMISVKVTDTDETKTVVSENKKPEELAKAVKFTGTVSDVDGNAIEGAEVYVVAYDKEYDIQDIWSDSNAIKLTTNSQGEYATSNKIKQGNYYLAVKKVQYQDVSQQIVITSTYGDTYTNEEIILFPADWKNKTGNVTGKILDSAQKDLALPNIAVRLRKGKGAVDSDIPVEKETRTDAQGMYLFQDIEAGYYTIELDDDKTQKNAYLRTWINVLIRPGETVTEGAIMSKTLADEQLRFVLSWGAKDSGAVADLDAHLRGPGGYEWEDDRFHTFYQNKTFENNFNEVKSHADLDVDDMDYEGPETTTIYERAPGIYSYYVHDYTNCRSHDSRKLSESSVKVEVYSGNYKQNTYYIPQKEGTVWHVFDYDSNTKTFQTVNTMYYEEDAWYVGDSVKQYKSQISSDLSWIESYYKSLVKGTGEDILVKVADYRKRMEALGEKQEADVAQLRYEVMQYLYELRDECYLWCSSEDVYNYEGGWGQENLTLFVGKPNFVPGAYSFEAGENKTVTEVTPTDKNAWKACKVVAENGHTRIIHVYVEFSLEHVWINSATVGEESLTIANGDYSTTSSYYPIAYVHSEKGTAFALKDIKFTFSLDSAKVIYDSKKVTGEYTVTIESDTKSKTWIVRNQPMPLLTTPDNTIYGMKIYGNTVNVYAESKALSEKCTMKVSGDEYAFHKEKSDPEYNYYIVNANTISYYVYCYSLDTVCKLREVYFNQNVKASIDESAGSITVQAEDEYVSAGDLTLGWATTVHGNAETKYEAVSGKDYIGKVTVSIDCVKDYTKEYKVYFKPYQP